MSTWIRYYLYSVFFVQQQIFRSDCQALQWFYSRPVCLTATSFAGCVAIIWPTKYACGFVIAPSILFRLTVYIPSHLPTSLIFMWKTSLKWHLCEMSGTLLSFFISDVQVDPRLPLLCLHRRTADIPLRLWSSSMILFKIRLLDSNVGRWVCCNYLTYKACMWICYCTIHLVQLNCLRPISLANFFNFHMENLI